MDTILFFGSYIALLNGIINYHFHKDFMDGVSGALILGIHRIGKILEQKAKSGLSYSFESVESIKVVKIRNQKMEGEEIELY